MSRLITMLSAAILVVVSITPASAAEKESISIGLIGDSTVADTYGWGPAFAKRFNAQAKVLNFAKNGATLDSLSAKLDEMLEQKPDLVLIQFGHNDQKRYGTAAYAEKLNSYVDRIKQAGAKPVILSSVTRRNFESNGKIAPRTERAPGEPLKGTLPEFAETAREVARQQSIHFIDLYNISVEHHNKLGPEASAAYNFDESDTTHFSPEGAAATAGLVMDELKVAVPEIAPYLK